MMGKKIRLKKDEGGYALALVLILLILIGLIIGPLLVLMTTTLMSAYRHEEGMLGFYAADAGIEDAAYKIQHEDGNLPEDVGFSYGYPEYPALYVNDSEVHVAIQRVSSEDPDDEVYMITSTATSGGGSTTVESYVKADRVDLSSFADHAITTNGEVTWQPPGADPPIDPPDSIEYDPEYWPTAEEVAAYFWEDVKNLTPFPSATIDVKYTDSIGPLYRNDSLTIKSTSSEDKTATLGGTVYVTGDLAILPGWTLNLNDKTIFVEGSITKLQCKLRGSGSIIAVGNIEFKPNIDSDPNEFIFVMSIGGTVTFEPQDDFFGAVAGDVKVQLRPDATVTLGDSSGFEWPSGGVAALDTLTYTIQ